MEHKTSIFKEKLSFLFVAFTTRGWLYRFFSLVLVATAAAAASGGWLVGSSVLVLSSRRTRRTDGRNEAAGKVLKHLRVASLHATVSEWNTEIRHSSERARPSSSPDWMVQDFGGMNHRYWLLRATAGCFADLSPANSFAPPTMVVLNCHTHVLYTHTYKHVLKTVFPLFITPRVKFLLQKRIHFWRGKKKLFCHKTWGRRRVLLVKVRTWSTVQTRRESGQSHPPVSSCPGLLPSTTHHGSQAAHSIDFLHKLEMEM